MKNRLLTILWVALTLLTYLDTPCLSQQNSCSKLKAIVRSEGWKIPFLKTMLVGSRVAWMRVGDDNSPTVYRSVLRPTGGKVLFEDTAFYTFDEGSGTLKIARQPLMADEVIRYDVNGKAFCYTVAGTCVSVTSDQKGVKRILFLGCTTGYAFYDEDGDGILEKLDLEGDPSRFKLHIPEWVAKSH